VLAPHDSGRTRSLVWRTEEDGKPVEYEREPARSNGQRLQANLMSLVNVDDEL
jgi:hypothetical protein